MNIRYVQKIIILTVICELIKIQRTTRHKHLNTNTITNPTPITSPSANAIWVITKLPKSEQSSKGKVKTHNYINRQNQSTAEH